MKPVIMRVIVSDHPIDFGDLEPLPISDHDPEVTIGNLVRRIRPMDPFSRYHLKLKYSVGKTLIVNNDSYNVYPKTCLEIDGNSVSKQQFDVSFIEILKEKLINNNEVSHVLICNSAYPDFLRFELECVDLLLDSDCDSIHTAIDKEGPYEPVWKEEPYGVIPFTSLKAIDCCQVVSRDVILNKSSLIGDNPGLFRIDRRYAMKVSDRFDCLVYNTIKEKINEVWRIKIKESSENYYKKLIEGE